MVKSEPAAEVVEQLTTLFRRNGYIRWPNPDRLAATPETYRKGCEVRLVANSKAELRTIRRLLKAAGFKAGRPFAKALQWRQPVYGQAQVTRLLQLVGWKPDKKPKPKAKAKAARGTANGAASARSKRNRKSSK